MKNLISVRVKTLIFASLVLIFASCGSNTKVDPGPPGGGGGGGTVTATLTVSAAPVTPLWNGDSWTFTVGSTNATSVTAKVNGISQTVTGGQLVLTNITENTEIEFSTNVGTGAVAATPITKSVGVLKPLLTTLNKNVQKWENVINRGLIGGVWTDLTPGCPSNPSKQFLLNGYCNMYNAPCGIGPNTSILYSLDANESHLTISNETVTVTRYTADSLFTLSADGLTQKGWVARR